MVTCVGRIVWSGNDYLRYGMLVSPIIFDMVCLYLPILTFLQARRWWNVPLHQCKMVDDEVVSRHRLRELARVANRTQVHLLLGCGVLLVTVMFESPTVFSWKRVTALRAVFVL